MRHLHPGGEQPRHLELVEEGLHHQRLGTYRAGLGRISWATFGPLIGDARSSRWARSRSLGQPREACVFPPLVGLEGSIAGMMYRGETAPAGGARARAPRRRPTPRRRRQAARRVGRPARGGWIKGLSGARLIAIRCETVPQARHVRTDPLTCFTTRFTDRFSPRAGATARCTASRVPGHGRQRHSHAAPLYVSHEEPRMIYTGAHKNDLGTHGRSLARYSTLTLLGR